MFLLGPIDGHGVAEPLVFEKLLALEKHGYAGRDQRQRRADQRTLLRGVAAGAGGSDLRGEASLAIRDLVVGFAVDDTLEAVAIVGNLQGRDHAVEIAMCVLSGDERSADRMHERGVPLRVEAGAAGPR